MTKLKTGFFVFLVNTIGLVFIFIFGEFAARWHNEGSIKAALFSLVNKKVPHETLGTNHWLVPDDALGYKLNPRLKGVNTLGLMHSEFSPEKPSGLFRVIVLGDSVAFDEEGFVSLIRRKMGELENQSIQVINASVPGYTTYQERLFLERDLLQLKPDLVLLQYCVNDNHKFLHMFNISQRWLVTPKAAKALLPERASWISRWVYSSYFFFEIRHRVFSLKWFQSSRFPWENREDVGPAWLDQTWPKFEEHLLAMRYALREIGAKFAVIVIPFESQLDSRLLSLDYDYTLKPQQFILTISSRNNIPLLDVFPEFYKENREYKLFRDSIHLSPKGHEIVARTLLKFFKDKKLLEGEESSEN